MSQRHSQAWFEHVVIRGATPLETWAEYRATPRVLENPHARVFVIFLDLGHVTVAGSLDDSR